MVNEKKVKQGKVSRAQGKDFEIRVRNDLLEKGWTVSRFDNDVKENKLIQAKTSWRRTPHGMFPMNISPGFPDFLAFMVVDEEMMPGVYDIIGVESKMTGELDRPEKEKCVWLLEQGVFSKILIASKHKIKNRIHIEYEDFKEKYFRFYK